MDEAQNQPAPNEGQPRGDLKFEVVGRAGTDTRRMREANPNVDRHLELSRAKTSNGYPWYVLRQFETDDKTAASGDGKWKKGQPRLEYGIRYANISTRAHLADMRERVKDEKVQGAIDTVVGHLDAMREAARENSEVAALRSQVTSLQKSIAQQIKEGIEEGIKTAFGASS